MWASTIHGSRHVTAISRSVRVPVFIFNYLIGDPEPETQSAGVAQSKPYVGRVGLLDFLLDPVLFIGVSNGHQVIVLLSAVIQGLLPGLVFFDQDEIIC